MKQIGKYLFPIPFLVFGVLHLINGAAMAGMVPAWLPGGIFWVYVTGLAQIAFALGAFAGKWDKTAAQLLAVFLLLVILLVHVPQISQAMTLSSLLKDLGLLAGALMYAEAFAKQK
ncbi:MAG TPA: DoxX family protein [Patescibacteria group bacterium]|nr:DoxX family protein [Patescibacteria group bacterium]